MPDIKKYIMVIYYEDSRYFIKLRVFFILAVFLFLSGTFFCGCCQAGGALGAETTFGSDQSLSSNLDFYFSLSDMVNASFGYSLSQDASARTTDSLYSFGLENKFTETVFARLNYAFSPLRDGYEYNIIGGDISLEDKRGGVDNDDFSTQLLIDFAQTNHYADIDIEGAKRHIKRNFNLVQTAWTFGLNETFYHDTALDISYTSFGYNKDIANPIFQKYLDLVVALGGIRSVNLPGLLFSISGFPIYSYNIGLTRYFSDEISVSVSYNPLVNYINNARSFYYSLKGEWFLSERWQLGLGYTLSVDEYKKQRSYYSPSLTFNF